MSMIKIELGVCQLSNLKNAVMPSLKTPPANLITLCSENAVFCNKNKIWRQIRNINTRWSYMRKYGIPESRVDLLTVF